MFCIIVCLLITYGCKSSFQNVERFNSGASIIKKGKIESVIFSKEADCFLCNLGVDRFSPSIEEINNGEEILAMHIKAANNPMYNQGNGCPIIHHNLKHYRRQYYGYIDNKGNKLLSVNLLWAQYSLLDRLKGYHKDDSDNWKRERIIILDGCTYYWAIDINLSQQKLQNLSINGPA